MPPAHIYINYKFFNFRITNNSTSTYTITIYYWYIVKNKSTEKANGGIGIIPYIVEDSIEYFKEIEKSSQKINPDTFKMDSKIVDIDFSKEKKVETEDERKNRIASIHGWNLSFTNPELFKDLE